MSQAGASSASSAMLKHRGNALFPPAGTTSGTLPGSPNVKAMQLPGMRNAPPAAAKRNHRASPDLGWHPTRKASPTPIVEEPSGVEVSPPAPLIENLAARTRRQPAGRAGPAFKQAIQEEDEGEEE